ncbi:IclR family transcriptional regulator C-terminal domain-containing protein [Streptomyces sp. NPDC005492]|uniref:IclR family transcriptional regulator domain-containing protein n=1 Tax=Streptomyces sp. NPDC005492 TaxID=3156883 RepID=UPI0033A404F1
MSRQDPDVLDSVEKAFLVLQAFSADHPALTVSEAAELTGLSRATARRVLLTCQKLGFAEGDDGRFRLTPRVLSLGYGYLSSLPLWDHAHRHMRDLADLLKESCSVSALDGGEIVYVARVPAKRTMALTLTVGSRLPAYPTSMGRVLLAAQSREWLDAYLAGTELVALTGRTITDRAELRQELDRVREQGFAVVDEEREEGVRSAAAPLRDRTGRVIAALNVSANAARVPLAELRGAYVPEVVRTAEVITRDMGFFISR